jgi:hypothetical protein
MYDLPLKPVGLVGGPTENRDGFMSLTKPKSYPCDGSDIDAIAQSFWNKDAFRYMSTNIAVVNLRHGRQGSALVAVSRGEMTGKDVVPIVS